MSDQWKARAANIEATKDLGLSSLSAQDLTMTTALERATKAIDEVASTHSKLGTTSSPVEEGANEVFFREYGPRAVFHHWRDGTHVLYGAIYQAYKDIGGARKGTAGAALGPPLGTEEWGSDTPITLPDGTVTQQPTRVVRFREGEITWNERQGARVSRTPNSTCRLDWDFEIVQQRSGNDWHDNDWLSAVWTIDGRTYPKTVPLVHRDTGDPAIHGRPENPDGRTPIATISDHVVCNRHDLVTVYYTVTNLSGLDRAEQVARATGITGSILEWIAPRYIDLASQVLKVVPGGGAVTAVVAASLPTYKDELVKLLGTAWDEVVTPVVGRVVEEVRTAFGGRANCSGPIMHDFVVFDPLTAVDQVLVGTYTSPRVRHCQTPETKVTIHMQRTV